MGPHARSPQCCAGLGSEVLLIPAVETLQALKPQLLDAGWGSVLVCGVFTVHT